MVYQNKLTDTQALLTYVAITCGSWREIVRASERATDTPSLWKMAKICKDWSDIYGDAFDCVYKAMTQDDVKFVRNALKGFKYGNKHNQMIMDIFGYCANI